MENKEKKKKMSFEEVLQDSTLVHIHDLVRYLQKIPSKDIFPEKYEMSVLDLAMEDTVELFDKDPNMPLKTVISTIITSFEDDLSADLILKMTKKIIAKWKKLSVTVLQEDAIGVAA